MSTPVRATSPEARTRLNRSSGGNDPNATISETTKLLSSHLSPRSGGLGGTGTLGTLGGTGKQVEYDADKLVRMMKQNGAQTTAIKNLAKKAHSQEFGQRETVQNLKDLSAQLAEKERNLAYITARYQTGKRELDDKKAQAKELRDILQKQQQLLVDMTKKTSSLAAKAAYWNKEITGNHTSRELEASRGYSCGQGVGQAPGGNGGGEKSSGDRTVKLPGLSPGR